MSEKKNRLKKAKYISIRYFKPVVILAAASLLFVFLATSCCAPLESSISWIEKIFAGFSAINQAQDEKTDAKRDSGSSQTTQNNKDILPAHTINIYIDGLIDYSNRNLILEGLEESIDAYNIAIVKKNASSQDEEYKSYIKYEGFAKVYDAKQADIVFKIVSGDDMNLAIAGPFYYAAVTSFYSLVEDISWNDFNEYWSGARAAFHDIEGHDVVMELAIGKSAFDIMENILGNCSAQAFYVLNSNQVKEAINAGEVNPGTENDNYLSDNKKKDDAGENNLQEETAQVESQTDINEALDNQEKQVISIVPLESIRPYQKVLKINSENLLDKNSSNQSGPHQDGPISYITDYPLVCAIGAEFNNNVIEKELQKLIKDNINEAIPSNRSDGDITSIMMTGVTALTRQVAEKMDEKGILYPADKIQDILLDADITHISNEVSFVPDCYAARPNTTVFCSKPEYIELLKYIDADVIELTGNHLNDYGPEWLNYTIDIYDKEGIPYFGGGRNIEDSINPAIFEINGYKFAFIGANPAGPPLDWATESLAGSAPINSLSEELKEKDMQKYEQIIKLLKSQGYIVIFTFQYQESEFYSPTSQQVVDFERIINAGANIVSGSQSHVPQGVKILDNGFINFGLGNLFFGQKPTDTLLALKVKQGIIAKHIFYKGSHISTELITTFIEDFSQPRLMTIQERADLLKSVFEGSTK